MGYVNPQVLGLLCAFGSPNGSKNMGMRQHLSGTCDQKTKHGIFRGSQIDNLAVDGNEAFRQINAQTLLLEDGRCLLTLRVPSSYPQTCQQFLRVKRFRDVIIRTSIKRVHFLRFAFANGKNDDGRRAPFAKTLDDLQPVEIGQAKVENYDIRFTAGGLQKPAFAGFRIKNAITLAFKAYAQEPPHLGFIVDDESNRFDLAHVFNSAASGCFSKGKRMIKTAPPSG